MQKRKGTKYEINRYRVLDHEVHAMCDKEKENWINQQCSEIKELESKYKTREMYENVRDVAGTNRKESGNSGIKNKEGKVLFDLQEIQDKWTEYIEELFNDERREIPQMDNGNRPIILKEEVKTAIDTLLPGKAPGEEEITTEMLQVLNETGIYKIPELCNKNHGAGYIPDHMRKSTFIPIPKKAKAVNCTDFRSLSFMGHVTNILLKIILHRNIAVFDREIGENRSGFRKEKGTPEGKAI